MTDPQRPIWSDTSVSVRRTIHASASDIFAILADPSLHPVIDGSGTVLSSKTPRGTKLALGSEFGMKMRIGLPYAIRSKVVEFDQDRVIAWQHIGGHRWRYELESNGENTVVTESFDWSTARSTAYITLLKWPQRHVANMERTLARLDALVVNRRQPI